MSFEVWAQDFRGNHCLMLTTSDEDKARSLATDIRSLQPGIKAWVEEL